MNRRAATVAGLASVGTAFLGTGWARTLASKLGASLNFNPPRSSAFGFPALPNLGDAQAPSISPSPFRAVPTAIAAKPVSTPCAKLAAVTPDPTSAFDATTLREELDELPLTDGLTTDERNDLQWMRVEENLARDACLSPTSSLEGGRSR
jgi:hypothetical protein